MKIIYWKINEIFSVLIFCNNVPSYINIHVCNMQHPYADITEWGWALIKQMSESKRRLPIYGNPKIMETNDSKKSFLSYLETLFLFEEILTILSLQNRRIKALFYFRQGLQKVKDLCQVCRRHISGFHSHSFSHHKSCIFMNCLLV